MQSLLEVKNISKEFKLPKTKIFAKSKCIKVLDNISFYINQDEILGIVGESGSGKSTLSSIIVRLTKESSGEIFFNSKNITNLNKYELKNLRKKIQIIFQNTYTSLNPSKRVQFLLEEYLNINTNMSKKEKEVEVDKTLEIIGLNNNYKKRYPKELSGGERQRIVIGMAIISKPKLIIADEPVSALDMSTQAQILDLLLNLKKEFKLSYMFISHDLNVINYLSDRILVINKGEIVEQGNAKDIYNNPKHPYTKMLFNSMLK